MASPESVSPAVAGRRLRITSTTLANDRQPPISNDQCAAAQAATDELNPAMLVSAGGDGSS